MPEHFKISLLPQPVPASALLRLQSELGMPLGTLEAKIAAGEPILDHQPPHHRVEDFLKSTASLVHALDNLGLTYAAWHNGEPVPPHHLRSMLTHKLHIAQSSHDGEKRHTHRSLEED